MSNVMSPRQMFSSPSTPGGSSRSRRRKRLRETVQHLAQDDSSSSLPVAPPARYTHAHQYVEIIMIWLGIAYQQAYAYSPSPINFHVKLTNVYRHVQINTLGEHWVPKGLMWHGSSAYWKSSLRCWSWTSTLQWPSYCCPKCFMHILHQYFQDVVYPHTHL